MRKRMRQKWKEEEEKVGGSGDISGKKFFTLSQAWSKTKLPYTAHGETAGAREKKSKIVHKSLTNCCIAHPSALSLSLYLDYAKVTVA